MKKYLGYIVGGMLAFSMLSGCGNTSGAIQNESDVYMSQFGEYENGGAQSTKGLSEYDADNAGGALTSSNGEKIFEETEFDGKPVEPAADIAPATPNGNQSTDQSLMAQTIGNPTENNSSSGSSSGSSDTGSGVGQTCDDGGGTDNSSSSNTAESSFE